MQNRQGCANNPPRCFSGCNCCCCCCCPGTNSSQDRSHNGQDGGQQNQQQQQQQNQQSSHNKQRPLLIRYIFVRLPAVFTGGLNWDKGSKVWINLCHLFIWIILVVLPYTLCMTLQKIPQTRNIAHNMAALSSPGYPISPNIVRNRTTLDIFTTQRLTARSNFTQSTSESALFYSSSSSAMLTSSSEEEESRTRKRQTVAVIYGCIIAVMFIVLKGILYFVHWKLDLVALDALAENNAKSGDKKKKKANNTSLAMRMAQMSQQQQQQRPQATNSTTPVMVNHHVLRSFSPLSESSMVNESSSSSYTTGGGGDNYSIGEDENISVFTPVIMPEMSSEPTKLSGQPPQSSSSSSTSAAAIKPLPPFQLSAATTTTTTTTTTTAADKSSSSSSGGNESHVSIKSSKISLAALTEDTGKGHGKKKGKRKDGRKKHGKHEANEECDNEDFFSATNDEQGKKKPPLPPAIFAESDNDGNLSDGSFSGIPPEREEQFSLLSKRDIEEESEQSFLLNEKDKDDHFSLADEKDASEAKRDESDDTDDDYEDGRDEKDVRTFVDENGEVMYYSFSAPSAGSSKVQEGLLSPIGPVPASPVKAKAAGQGSKQHKRQGHRRRQEGEDKRRKRTKKRDEDEGEDEHASGGGGNTGNNNNNNNNSNNNNNNNNNGDDANKSAAEKAEQERNDEEIARALWEQQLNPRVKVPVIKRYVSRETLVKLFDRDENLFVVIVTTILAAGLAFCSYLTEENFTGFSRFWFWVVVAGAQYCLLKSPQPDSFTPSVEGGLTVTYTRSAYLILATVLILLMEELSKSNGEADEVQEIIMYGWRLDIRTIASNFKSVVVYCILVSPVLYVFSMLPQIDTLLFYFFEQVNILVFGASGSPNFVSALFEFVRSLFSASVVGILCVIGAQVPVVRSVAVGVAMAFSFFNSRVVNNVKALVPTFRQFTFKGNRFSFWIETEDGRRIRAQDSPQVDYNALCSAYPPRRLVHDCIKSLAIFAITFVVSITGILQLLNKEISWLMDGLALILGIVFDALIPRLRHAFPFNRFQRPFLETELDPETGAMKTMWFERLLIYARMVEEYIVYPALLIGYFENSLDKDASMVWTIIISVALMRALRSTFTDVTRNHLFLLFTVGFFTFDYKVLSENFTVNYFVGSILMLKMDELVTKFDYFIVYIAPWNLSWGSTYHAAIQPLALPHTTFFILQNVASTVISSPLYPVLGSVVFLTSYPRPVKYWEKTRPVDWSDTTNTPLHASLAVTHTATNPDALFYYHLQMALQKTLNRDREAGRMGSVHVGDMYLLTNDTLTALIHIVSIGNGYTTFQLRGLELQGTICQEQELECIRRFDYSLEPNCCLPRSVGGLPPLLSFKDSRDNRWHAWRVVNTAFYLRAYSISIMPATPLFNMFTYRQVLVRMYVCALAYYFIESESLDKWLGNPAFAAAAERVTAPDYVEKDPLFYRKIDADYDRSRKGVSFDAFKEAYGEWVAHCLAHRHAQASSPPSSLSASASSSSTDAFLDIRDASAASSGGNRSEDAVLRMLFALSISARRMLVLNRACALNTGMFLQRYYSLLGGDFRVTSEQDEWMLTDLSVVDHVVSRAIRVSLRLHQAYFAKEDIDAPEDLRAALQDYERNLVVCREDSPEWRASITSDPPVPQLLSLRKQHDPQAGDVFSVVFLTMQHQPFTLTRLNRECVRGFWAGQQQELVYLGNDNCERGSIQKLNSVLRNLINQACDPPVGYPAFVSELTTSYSRFWPYTTEFLDKGKDGCARRAFKFSESYREFKNEGVDEMGNENDRNSSDYTGVDDDDDGINMIEIK